jgi:hypothetical protein
MFQDSDEVLLISYTSQSLSLHRIPYELLPVVSMSQEVSDGDRWPRGVYPLTIVGGLLICHRILVGMGFFSRGTIMMELDPRLGERGVEIRWLEHARIVVTLVVFIVLVLVLVILS